MWVMGSVFRVILGKGTVGASSRSGINKKFAIELKRFVFVCMSSNQNIHIQLPMFTLVEIQVKNSVVKRVYGTLREFIFLGK